MLLLLKFDSFPEISLRTVLHYQTKGIVVSEIGFVCKNVGVVELTEQCRFLPVVRVKVGYSYLLQRVLKQHKTGMIHLQNTRFTQAGR